MITDSRILESGTTLNAQVIIAGGGIAGITIALELERRGIGCIVLESGGFEWDFATEDLNNGHSTGLPYQFASGCRSRYLGGSSNCWGGWCRPFDSWDFEKRSWIPNSGWPISAAEIAPYYRLTHDYLDLGPFNYDVAEFEHAVNRPDVRRFPLAGDAVTDSLSQFSPPTQFGTKYRRQLQESATIHLLLHANVTSVQTNSDAGKVQRVQCQTLSGARFTVRGNQYVLAAGGIENARLLLASNEHRSAGIGNEHDVVGRYFMDHPRIHGGTVRFRREWNRNKLFDFKFHLHSDKVSVKGTQVAAALTLTRSAQEQEQITNSRVWFSSRFIGDDSQAHRALADLRYRALRPTPGFNLAPLTKSIMSLASHPVDAAGYLLGRKFLSHALTREVKMQAIAEPDPDPDSRVTLSTDDKDALGMPRVNVHWRLSNLVRRTFNRSFAMVADTLERSDLADVTLFAPLQEDGELPGLDPRGTWHHMGTTRMHESAKLGVVNSDGRVHSVGNLYVAGSSIFPTAAANFPTQTIVALAIRLADHLIGQESDASAAWLRPSDRAIGKRQETTPDKLIGDVRKSQTDHAASPTIDEDQSQSQPTIKLD